MRHENFKLHLAGSIVVDVFRCGRSAQQYGGVRRDLMWCDCTTFAPLLSWAEEFCLEYRLAEILRATFAAWLLKKLI